MHYLQKQSSHIRDENLILRAWEKESYCGGMAMPLHLEWQTRQGCPVNTVTEQKKLNLRKEEIQYFPLVTPSNKNSRCCGVLAHYVKVIMVQLALSSFSHVNPGVKWHTEQIY